MAKKNKKPFSLKIVETDDKYYPYCIILRVDQTGEELKALLAEREEHGLPNQSIGRLTLIKIDYMHSSRRGQKLVKKHLKEDLRRILQP